MPIAAWLRFASMALLVLWLGVHYSRVQQALQRLEALLFSFLAVLTIAQFGLEAASVTDPLTPLPGVLRSMALSVFGALSLVVVLATGMAAFWTFRLTGRGQTATMKREPLGTLMLSGLAVLALMAGNSFAEPNAAAVASSSGPLVFSPTLNVPRNTVALKNPYAGDAASLERGKVVYQANCQICHGISGDGRGPAGANLRIKPASFRNPIHFQSSSMDGPHFWVIQHGDGETGGMPGWQGTLSDQQTWDVLNYVKSLSGQAS